MMAGFLFTQLEPVRVLQQKGKKRFRVTVITSVFLTFPPGWTDAEQSRET